MMAPPQIADLSIIETVAFMSSMVYGDVYRLCRLGNGTECLWDGFVLGWWSFRDQTVYLRLKLYVEDEQL